VRRIAVACAAAPCSRVSSWPGLVDPSDRRSILVGHTQKGLGFLKQMNAILQRATKRA
jgi:hypothetical protein